MINQPRQSAALDAQRVNRGLHSAHVDLDQHFANLRLEDRRGAEEGQLVGHPHADSLLQTVAGRMSEKVDNR